jgi:ABC-type nickel/cobalt efflux system permease component RcnA
VSPLERLRSPDGPLDPLLVRLIDDPQLGGAAALLGLLIAAGVGAVHALGPGHGKALIGAYLAGSRGRVRDAVALGLLVALMHTGSVLLLASGLRTAQNAAVGQRLEAILTMVVAGGIFLLGCRMLRDRWRLTRRRRHHEAAVLSGSTVAASGAAQPGVTASDHGHDAREDGHGRHSGHHHELPEGVAPLSRAGLVALAGAGGLLPSPVALLVLVTALAMGRTGYGIALLLAFSLGLAATLTGIGLTILCARTSLERRVHRPHVSWLIDKLPIGSALALLAGGLFLGWAAVNSL